MTKYPEPHIEREWPPDFVEDYAHAKSDEERRIMLLRFGYDDAHYGDVLYLFGEPPTEPLPDGCTEEPTAPYTVSTQFEEVNPISYPIKKIGKGIVSIVSFVNTFSSLIERVAKQRENLSFWSIWLATPAQAVRQFLSTTAAVILIQEETPLTCGQKCCFSVCSTLLRSRKMLVI